MKVNELRKRPLDISENYYYSRYMEIIFLILQAIKKDKTVHSRLDPVSGFSISSTTALEAVSYFTKFTITLQ